MSHALLDDTQGWMSTRQVAREWGRSQRTVQDWCATGSILAFGFVVMKDWTGRWWLRLASSQTRQEN